MANDNTIVHYALQREWSTLNNGIANAEAKNTRLNREIFETCETLTRLRANKLELEQFAAKQGLPPLPPVEGMQS